MTPAWVGRGIGGGLALPMARGTCAHVCRKRSAGGQERRSEFLVGALPSSSVLSLSVGASVCRHVLPMAGVYGVPDLAGQRTRKQPKGHWVAGEEAAPGRKRVPRATVGREGRVGVPGTGCSENRDRLNSLGLEMWEQNLSVAKVEWFKEQLIFTSKSNRFSTGCLNTKIPTIEWRHCVCVCACVLSHLVMSDSATPWSPWGSSVHGIIQARILEQVAKTSSRGSSQECKCCLGGREDTVSDSLPLTHRANTFP